MYFLLEIVIFYCYVRLPGGRCLMVSTMFICMWYLIQRAPPSPSPCGPFFLAFIFYSMFLSHLLNPFPTLLWNEINEVDQPVIMFNASQYQFVIFFAKAPFQPFPIGIQSWERFHSTEKYLSFRFGDYTYTPQPSDAAQEVSLKQDSSCAFSLCFWHSDSVKTWFEMWLSSRRSLQHDSVYGK